MISFSKSKNVTNFKRNSPSLTFKYVVKAFQLNKATLLWNFVDFIPTLGCTDDCTECIFTLTAV